MAGIVFNKASGLNDSIYGKSQEPIRMMIEQQIEAFQQFSVVDNIFMMDETTNFAEKYTYETSLGDFEAVGEGGAYPRNSFQEGYSKVIEPEEWKNSFEVTQTMIEDAKFGKIKQRANQFTLSYNRGREKFATALLNNGTSTSLSFGNNQATFNIAAADSKALFATDHPSITGGGTQSNYFGNAFSYDALCYAEEAMQKFTDDDGNILNIMPDTIIIPSNARIKKQVFDAIGAEIGAPGTANNSFNIQFGRWNVIMSPYLTNASGITSGTDTWYLMDSTFNEAFAGLVWLERVSLTIKSYVDENTDNNVFKARARYGAAPNNWRAIAKVNPGLGTELG